MLEVYVKNMFRKRKEYSIYYYVVYAAGRKRTWLAY